MAYYGPLTHFIDSASEVAAPGEIIMSEGLALVRAQADQAAGLRVATGAAGEIFAGFSTAGTSAAPFPEGYANKVERFLVPSTGIVTLARTPVTGQVGVYDVTNGAAIPVAAPVVVTGNQIAGLTPGDEVEVTYKYALTVLEARTLYGDVQPGGYVGAYVGQIGVGKRGTIYTDNIDTSADWSTAKAIKMGPNGQLKVATLPADQALVIPAVIKALPSQDRPFLGVEFSAV